MARKELQKQAKQLRARKRARHEMARKVRRVALIAVIVLAVAGFATRYFNRPGEPVPSQGREHIPVGTSHTVQYNSDPPTSGPHYDPSAGPGIYDEPMPDGYLIHSLEHGYVIISHNTEGMPTEQQALRRCACFSPSPARQLSVRRG